MTATTSKSTQTGTAKRHPIRGGLYGIVLGLGLALMVVGRKIVTLDSVLPIVLVVVGIVIGVLWGMFATAKKPRGAAPAANASPAETAIQGDGDD
ncbi:MAG: hypothetical protein ACKVHU_13620 [Acidimicrobiales bacterium]|jgi:hypothetical protein